MVYVDREVMDRAWVRVMYLLKEKHRLDRESNPKN
jgi:hypothetical protein